MTKCLLLSLLLLSSLAQAYVPSVESLFRFGSNSDVTVNGVSLALRVKRMDATAATGEENLLKDGAKGEEYYRIYFTKAGGEALKVAQVRYSDTALSDSAVTHKVYYPNFTPHTLKPEQLEKGLFYSLLHTLSYNNGSQMVSYLQTLGVPVKHNNEIINREKIDYLTRYKRYLVTINQNRAARKTEVNPLQPEDPAARERADTVMNESMYVDQGNVKLGRDEGQMAWVVNAGAFESVVSYKERAIQKFKYKTGTGEFSVQCKDYWLANGTHSFPRYFLIKTLSGESFHVEVVELRHYLEKEDDIVRRQKKWDQVLKGKTSSEPRPEFLL